MYKIDLKDRRILYQLDLDARQSLTQIGKKVGLKKDVVSYRIKRMEDEGIIKSYWTLIDAYKLGYNAFRFYLVFQYFTPEIKKEIIDYLVKDKRTWVVFSIIGKYDLGVVLWLKDLVDFYQFWERMLDKYGDYFAEKIFSIYVQAYSYRLSYLLPEEFRKTDRDDYEAVGVGKPVQIDDFDLQLLNEIAVNARAPLVDIAEKLNCSSQVVNYHLKNLINLGVIQGFRVAVDISKFGLKTFKVDIHLKEHSQRKRIMNYVKYNPNLTFIGTSAGVSDLELELDLEDSFKVNQIMEDINIKFPGAIRKFEYFMSGEDYKLRNMPEI